MRKQEAMNKMFMTRCSNHSGIRMSDTGVLKSMISNLKEVVVSIKLSE